MNYNVHSVNRQLHVALGISEARLMVIKRAIGMAYTQDVSTVDEIVKHVAPFIETPEEGFYAAAVIISDTMLAELEARGTIKGPSDFFKR